jgi:DNA-binding response OmpR family regulator
VKVQVVRWPSEESLRQRCLESGVPRLLLVEYPHPPPLPLDSFEDWVRLPVRREDVQHRMAVLSARAQDAAPSIEDEAVLRFRGQILPLSDAEITVVQALVQSYKSVVRRPTLEQLLWPNDPRCRRNALDLRMHRLRQRVELVGLSIRTVWGKGYLLDERR